MPEDGHAAVENDANDDVIVSQNIRNDIWTVLNTIV